MGRTLGIALGLLALTTSSIFAQPAAGIIALKGARIHTQTDAGDFVGTVVIRGGKIAAVGADVAVPAGATVIDASRCVITPGLIDAHGVLGVHASSATEGGSAATLNILDAIDPFTDDWRDAARQGVTAVYVQPAGGGNLGGSGAVLRVCGADCADNLALRSPAGVQAALGMPPAAPAAANNPLLEQLRQRGIQIPAQPANTPPPASTTLTRYAQYEQLRGQFDAAKRYGANKPARPEAAKELLLRAIKGEVPVRLEVHNEDDLRNALKLVAEFGLKAQLEHVERAKPMPEEMKASRAALVVGPFAGTRPSADVRRLALDGRAFAIGTFGSEARATAGLRLHAAAAVAGGYPRDRVLRALTRDAAELLGVGDRLGRIAVGRPADLVVFAGDPLDPSAPVRLAISQGTVTHDNPAAEPVPLPAAAAVTLPDKLPPSYVLKTTRLLQASGEFAPGELLVVNGRLSDPAAKGDAPVFDLGDAPVTPGLVAAQVGVGGELFPDADAGQLRAADGLLPDDGRVRNCRDAGFLTAVVAPGSFNVVGGTMSVLRADGEPVDVGMKFVLTSAARNNERFPVSLAGQVELIDARLRGVPPRSDLYVPAAVRDALLAQRERGLAPVRERRLPAYFEAQTRAEVAAALRLIADHRLRGVLLLPRDVAELADDIRQAGVPVVVGPARPQDAESVTQGLAALGKAGVPLALGGDPAEMRATAAWLANNGVPRPAARRALLGVPAEALGLPATTARLQAGDAADIVVWTGDPLDTASRPAAIVAQGQRQAIGGGDDAPPSDPRRPAAAPARTGRRGR